MQLAAFDEFVMGYAVFAVFPAVKRHSTYVSALTASADDESVLSSAILRIKSDFDGLEARGGQSI